MLPNPSVCGYLPFFCPGGAKTQRECILPISLNWAITLKVEGGGVVLFKKREFVHEIN